MNQSQATSRLWCSSHSWSESLSRVSKAARLALAVVFEAVLPASHSLGWCKVHMPAPSLWLIHQKYFLPSKVSTKALFSLLSVSLGGFPFHAHLSPAFFFCSLVFLAGAFLAACFLPAGFSFFVLEVAPCRSFFKELISAVIATIFSCSSVGLPHAFSSSKSLASYLFSALLFY